jgi:hypothetical protein
MGVGYTAPDRSCLTALQDQLRVPPRRPRLPPHERTRPGAGLPGLGGVTGQSAEPRLQPAGALDDEPAAGLASFAASRALPCAGPNTTGTPSAAGSTTECSPDVPNPPPTYAASPSA